MSQPSMTIRPEGDKIRIEFDRDALPEGRLGGYLSLMNSIFLAELSTMTDEQADQLAEDIKADWWGREGQAIMDMLGVKDG